VAKRRNGWGVWRGISMIASLGILWACSKDLPETGGQSGMSNMIASAKALVGAPAPAPQPKLQAAPAPPPPAIEVFLKPDRPLQAGDYVWDASGAPNAPLRIVVDIAAQRLYVYRGRVEIGRSSLIYGADDKPTPMGTFPILEKDKDHESNLYDAAMPHMLRLTWDGVAIHGSQVDDWAATNGCIGIPDEFAALLFAEAKLGDKVTITNDWMTDIYGA
jgi:lipoprotein-anchoring transpeptidase ErfK/SrfK